MLNAHKVDSLFKALCFPPYCPGELKAIGDANGKGLRKIAVCRAIDDIRRWVDKETMKSDAENA